MDVRDGRRVLIEGHSEIRSSVGFEHIADMAHWMGGLPADAPPHRTPEYDAMDGRARSGCGEAED